MTKKVLIVIAVVALLLVCCGVVAWTPVGNAIGVSKSDCDAEDRRTGDRDCASTKARKKKPTKTPTKTRNHKVRR